MAIDLKKDPEIIFRMGPKAADFSEEAFGNSCKTIVLDRLPFKGSFIEIKDGIVGKVCDKPGFGENYLVVYIAVNLYGPWLIQVIVRPIRDKQVYSDQKIQEGYVWQAQADYPGDECITKDYLQGIVKPRIIDFLARAAMGCCVTRAEIEDATGFYDEVRHVLMEMKNAGEADYDPANGRFILKDQK